MLVVGRGPRDRLHGDLAAGVGARPDFIALNASSSLNLACAFASVRSRMPSLWPILVSPAPSWPWHLAQDCFQLLAASAPCWVEEVCGSGEARVMMRRVVNGHDGSVELAKLMLCRAAAEVASSHLVSIAESRPPCSSHLGGLGAFFDVMAGRHAQKLLRPIAAKLHW